MQSKCLLGCIKRNNQTPVSGFRLVGIVGVNRIVEDVNKSFLFGHVALVLTPSLSDIHGLFYQTFA